MGGIAPASTVDYYQMIVDRYRQRRPDGTYPRIVIDSIDLSRMVELVTGGRLDELVEFLGEEIERLARAGAEVGLLASNTPHIVFDRLQRASRIPLLSIVEAAAHAASELGLRTVGLLGTRFTMQGSFYPDVFARAGIEVRPPSAEDVAYVHDKYIGELITGSFRAETRAAFTAVIRRPAQGGVEAVLLAGTELPLLLRDADPVRVPLLDTARIHVDRAVEALAA